MTVLLEAEGLRKVFSGGVRAVDDVDIEVNRGETLGIVGESGCGKSTTAKLLLRLLTPDRGSIRFDGADLGRARGTRLRKMRADLQLVPQHPMTSLNPRVPVGASIEFNMRAQDMYPGRRSQRVRELMAMVGLPPEHADRYPHELSGGQLQRVAIARALATDPKLLVCDEAVSALDKSVQAQVLNLLVDIQQQLGVAYIFISHDLAVVEHIADRVAVMYLGRIVEEGPAKTLWREPMHPYTRALLSAMPGYAQERIILSGDPPSPVNLPSGCRFRTRCPDAITACESFDPPLVGARGGGAGQKAACVHVKPLVSTSP
ncbi:MAG: oligopeptide/dipeptide transporter, ATPase subunit [Ilumatobacteraceae bacterium]|nr:oligopeptide/dipeptide transporter, ATPase subunit [Ilumatobacteraceae bacterium]